MKIKRKILSLLTCTLLFGSTTLTVSFAESTPTELADFAMTRAFQTLDVSDISQAVLLADGLETTTGSAIKLAVPILQEYKSKKDTLAVKSSSQIINEYPSLISWLESQQNIYVSTLLGYSNPPGTILNLVVDAYVAENQSLFQQLYTTKSTSQLSPLYASISNQTVKTAVESEASYFLSSVQRVESDIQLLNSSSPPSYITRSYIQKQIDSLPNGVVKTGLQASLEGIPVTPDTDPTEVTVSNLLVEFYSAPTQVKLDRILSDITRGSITTMTQEVTNANSYLSSYTEFQAKLSSKEFIQAKQILLNVNSYMNTSSLSFDKQLVATVNTTTFNTSLNAHLTQLLALIQSSFSQTDISSFTSLDTLLTTSRMNELNTVVGYKTEAERLVIHAEVNRTNIAEARAYVTTYILAGEYKSSLLTRLDNITNTSTNKSKSELEREIRKAVRDRSKSNFKSYMKEYLDNYSTSDEEMEAFISVYNKSDSTISDLFSLLDYLDKSSLSDKDVDRAQDLIDDMPRAARDYYQDDLDKMSKKDSTNGTISSTRITVKRNDLTSTGKSIYDTLENFSRRTKTTAQKEEVYRLINTLKYNSSLAELDKVIKDFNLIIAKDISNRNVREFFETLYR